MIRLLDGVTVVRGKQEEMKAETKQHFRAWLVAGSAGPTAVSRASVRSHRSSTL